MHPQVTCSFSHILSITLTNQVDWFEGFWVKCRLKWLCYSRMIHPTHWLSEHLSLWSLLCTDGTHCPLSLEQSQPLLYCPTHYCNLGLIFAPRITSPERRCLVRKLSVCSIDMGAFPTGRFHFAVQLDQCSLERPEESMQHHTHLMRTEE